MPKNIVFCADGTWNKPTETDAGIIAPTNVSQLYQLLLNDGVRQVAYYDDGVGTSTDELVNAFQGATGAGLAGKIMDGYQYLMNTWEMGDSIFLFGFSRGAYTVRCLGNMVGQCGLLPKIAGESAADERTRVQNTYLAYRQSTLPILADFRARNNCNDCEIQAIGVWDTVGALGIPLSIFAPLDQALFNFHNTALHENVHFGYQALAIDEERLDFKPTLWDARVGITQVWFAGAHADVGGGYSEHGLSDIALAWMMTQALASGVYFQEMALVKGVPIIVGNPYDVQHYPWQKPPFSLLPIAKRVIPDGSEIHNSVQKRMLDTSLNYNPSNLPSERTFV